MKTLGLIGGLSWYSTSVYYKTINELTGQRIGSEHSARLILYSVDFNDFRVLQANNDWTAVAEMLSGIALTLQNAGAACIVMCTNTPHLIAGQIRQKITIPLIHIAEETGKEIVQHQINKVALLGTRFTMENSFFKDILSSFGIETIVPDAADQEFIHHAIFEELTKGAFKAETKTRYLESIEKLGNDGAEAVIFGCTEISLLINPSESCLKVFDTTVIHSKAAVDFALDK
jgi:aspartate racemase